MFTSNNWKKTSLHTVMNKSCPNSNRVDYSQQDAKIYWHVAKLNRIMVYKMILWDSWAKQYFWDVKLKLINKTSIKCLWWGNIVKLARQDIELGILNVEIILFVHKFKGCVTLSFCTYWQLVLFKIALQC